MSTATHARQRFPRLAALLRTGREDRPARPVASVGMRDSGVPAYQPGPSFAREDRPDITAPRTLAAVIAEAQAAARENGTPPAETEPWGPPWDLPDGLLMNGADLTDGRMVPGYVPEPPRRHSPDIAADLTALPLFRAAVEHRTRHRAGECRCGHQVDGQAWGERMVRAGQHLTGVEAAA